MQRRLFVSLALITILLGLGAGIGYLLILTRPDPLTRDDPRPAVIVKAVRVQPRSFVESILAFGTARADRFAWISAEVSGRIVETAPELKIGAAFEQGSLLLRLDEREYQRELERSQSLLAAETAQRKSLDVATENVERLIAIAATETQITSREYDRVRELLERGSSNPREYDRARLDYQQARRTLQRVENEKALLPDRKAELDAKIALRNAELALAALNLERCTIVAPFAGRIEAVRVEVGEHVAPGAQLLALLDPRIIEVPIELAVSQSAGVRAGAACELSVESMPNVAWSGRIRRIAPAADEANRTVAVFVEVDNTGLDHPLVPGYFVRALIAGPQLNNVMTVPRGCVQDNRVFVYNDGLTHALDVRIERHVLDQSIVTGLAPGAIVITSNLDVLYDGAPVALEDPDLASQPPETGFTREQP